MPILASRVLVPLLLIPLMGSASLAKAEEPGGGKTYRTLCVRTCDGYYFPISSASRPGSFARDFDTCSRMCPFTKVKLYYHSFPEEETTDMVSVTGEPYADLPTAYRYRVSGLPKEPGCSCQQGASKSFSVIGGKQPEHQNYQVFGDYSGGEKSGTDIVPQPANPLEAPTSDTGSILRFGEAAVIPLPDSGNGSTEPDPILVPEPTGPRRIRVVGPAFLPDPAAAEDQPVPVPTPAR